MSAITTIATMVALLSGGQGIEKRPENLNDAVEWVLQYREVPKADAIAVRDALLREARNNEKVKNSVIFASEACYLLHLKSIFGTYGSFIEESEMGIEGFAAVGKRYVSDGVLPAVRYKIGDESGSEWLRKLDEDFRESPAIEHLLKMYAGLRELGLRPDQSWARVSEGSAHDGSFEGVDQVTHQLEKIGRWALTGYNLEDAEKDTPALFESWYAYRHHSAKDTKAVVPAAWPSMFIGNKLELAFQLDLRHMMRPADKVIDEEEARLAAERRAHPALPKPAPTAPATLSLFPNSDWMKPPGAMKPPQPFGTVIDTLAIEGYAFRCFDTKEIDPGGGARRFQLAKYLATCPVAPGHLRGGYRDFTGFDGSYSHESLKPNADYDLFCYPWYWSPKANCAFFLQGDISGNGFDEIKNPASQGRLNLPASSGQVIEVRLRVHTDNAGRFRLLLVQSDISAISLGLWYIKPATK